METLGLLDDKNINLWNYLNTVQVISIEKQNRDDYLVYTEGNTSIIYVQTENLNSASFTHELLHILIKVKGISVGGCLFNLTRGNSVLTQIFSNDLIDHIGNCLEHIKMLPEFLSLGYKVEEFIDDYHSDKLTSENVSLLTSTFCTRRFFSKSYNGRAVDCFIGGYFAAKACPNIIMDHSLSLFKLKRINPELYVILDDFLLAWHEFDIVNQDILTRSYRNLVIDFVANIKAWASSKKIV